MFGARLRYSSLLVQAYHTPPRCGGSSRLFGELCKYGFDLSGKGGTGESPGTQSYPWNKQTALPSWKELAVWKDANTYDFKKALALFCIMFLCIALSQLSSDSLLSWVACQGRDKNASFGAVHKWRHHFPSSFWPFPPPRYPFCIIYFLSVFDTLLHLKNEDVNYCWPLYCWACYFYAPIKIWKKKKMTDSF